MLCCCSFEHLDSSGAQLGNLGLVRTSAMRDALVLWLWRLGYSHGIISVSVSSGQSNWIGVALFL